MHRLSSQSIVNRFRVASILLLAKWLLVPAALATLARALLHRDKSMTAISGGIALVIIVVTIIQWVIANRTRCPLCLTPSLAKKNCSKHRSARRLLGSYRLRVALSILFRGHFRCPYCGEPTAMEVRERRRHHH